MARKPKSILKNLKKALKIPKTKAQKDKYLEGQARKMSKFQTEPERLFEDILKDFKIEYKQQEIVGGKIYDFYIPSKNLLVETDGDYYHAKDVEIKDMNSMQKKSFLNDKKKDSIAKSSGYQLERVWESDLKNNFEDVKKRFSLILLI